MNTAHLLLIDDDSDDHLLLHTAVQRSRLPIELSYHDHRIDCRELHGLLTARSLILLDFNMPGRNGIDLLSSIRTDPNLKQQPVLIYSTTCQPESVRRAYAAGANAFLRKPDSFTDFIRLLGDLCSFWFQSCVLPPTGTAR